MLDNDLLLTVYPSPLTVNSFLLTPCPELAGPEIVEWVEGLTPFLNIIHKENLFDSAWPADTCCRQIFP
jgi:hypothetical protein